MNNIYGMPDNGSQIGFEGTTEEFKQLLNSGGITPVKKAPTLEPGVFLLPNGRLIRAVRIKKVVPPPPVAPAFDVLKDHQKAASEFPPRMHEHTKELTAFLVSSIAPYESAVSTALSDASEVLRAITGSASLEMNFGRAESLLKHRLPELAVIQWAIKKLNLDEDVRKLVLQSYFDTNSAQRNQTNHTTEGRGGNG